MVLKGPLGNEIHITLERLKILLTGLNSNKSSTYILRCESLENGRLGISFTCIQQEQECGPRIDPWGTPEVTGNQDEQVPFSTTHWNGLTDNWITNETELVECSEDVVC